MNLSFKRLNLLKKLTLLVALPLAFEICFVASLVILQDRAEKEAERQRAGKTIVAQTNRVNSLILEGGSAAAMYVATEAPAYRTRYENVRKDLPLAIQDLSQSLRGNADLSRSLENINLLTKRAMHRLDYLMAQDKVSLYTQLAKIQVGMSSITETIAAESKKIIDSQGLKGGNEAPESAWRHILVFALVGGVVGSILLSLALMAVMYSDIVKRIAVMIDNTKRVAERTELHKPLDGEDEIAQLDRFFHDMTKRLEAHEALKKEFIAMVTHDLRTPLTNLCLFLEMTRAGIYKQSDEVFEDHIDHLIPELDRINRLLNDLLQLDKIESGMSTLNKQSISDEELVDAAINAVLNNALAKQVNIVKQCEDKRVIADLDRVTQVIINIVQNAIKFSPPNSTIWVKSQAKDNYLEFSIIDEGPGISPADAAKIFERYKQADTPEKTSGFGLGLAVSNAIIEQHGGSIGVKQREGKTGCHFWFTLPLFHS